MGADLEPGTLLAAYRRGLFPMPADDPRRAAMLWWSPVERGVLPLDGLRVSRSLRQSVRKMEVRVDTAFDDGDPGLRRPRRDGAWIDEEILAAYTRLHELGWAHSVEAWQDGELVGGLYGVAVGGLFAGESMFHRVTDASKVALVGAGRAAPRRARRPAACSTCSGGPSTSRRSAWSSVARPAYLRMLADAAAVPLPRAFR